MTKLNEIRDNVGAHKKRMSVGLGPGSCKGKTAACQSGACVVTLQ